MKKKELDELKKTLIEEKNKILNHLEKLSASQEISDANANAGDSADIASLEINQASLQKIGKREAYLLKKIDLALRKIEEGTYGECESCGEPISVARLRARPVAQLCIDCKTEQENVERRYSSDRDTEEEDEMFEETTEEV
jgi:DnaK suppressor protein